ncbi:multidrug effflux MFS transporter [uncultured Shimia sp.]|uniref:multidrug effflux MFS transporter n=1 Tax=uncultured Shimia sp. TaxID=573152 RepID=UPI002604D6E5|nr:multidrug effflux MFS transporter [uncultured Shimia sp.]
MLKAATSPPRVSTLVLMTAVSVLSLNMYLPSLAHIAQDFEVSYAMANLSISGYLAITACLQIIMGPLSDRYGRRPLLMAGLLIYTVASFGCLFAQDIWVFLVFRMFQGAIVAGMALSRAVVRDMHDERSAASLMGYISLAMAVAPMTGPMFGGFLDQLFGWRSNFLFFAVVGVALTALCWWDLGETNMNKSKTILSQFRTYPDLFRSRRFWGYSICQTFSLGAFYVYVTGAALVGAAEFKLSTSSIGIAVGAITGGFALGSYLSGRFASRVPLFWMVIAGRVSAMFGVILGLSLMASGVLHPVTYTGAIMFVGLGNGLTLPSASSGVMSVRPNLAGSASGLSGGMAVAGGALLTSLTGALLTPETAALRLLLIILGSVLVSFLAALYVRHIDLREGATY